MSTGMGENVLVLMKAATTVVCLVGLYAIINACASRWFNKRERHQ